MSKIPENPFILVDGSSYLFRAYHALPPLTNTKGQPTGAIYGVTNMLRKLMKEYKPQRMAVIFDSKEKNFRHQLYEPYKANRLVMPDELQCQIPPLLELIKAMGLSLIIIPGIEADDIIGSLSMIAKAKGLFTLISTGDKDFAQLVDKDIFLINTMSQDIFDRARVLEKFEVAPEQIVEYLTLIGDSVDNIPGIPNVGPKTAVKWLKSYGSLKNLIDNASEVTGKVGEHLRANLDKLPLYRDLVTIDVNLSLGIEWDDLLLKSPDQEKLFHLMSELEFKSWLRDLAGSKESTALVKEPNSEGNKSISFAAATTSEITETKVAVGRNQIALDSVYYEIIFKESELTNWVKELEKSALFCFDVETTSLNYMAAELVGVSFSLKSGHAAYVPFGHDYPNVEKQLDRDWVLKTVKPLLENENLIKIGHNLKYDTEVLANYGINLRGIAYDTMLESYVLDSAGIRHNMDALSAAYLGHKPITYEDIAGKGAKQLSFNQIAIEKAAIYAAEDADVTLRLHEYLWPKLESIPSLKKIFQTIEMPLVSVLARMERLGVLIDINLLKKQSEELGKRLSVLEEEIYTLAGGSFNINSPKQLQEILYNQLKLPIYEKTPTGQPSTAESVLQELAVQYPLPKLILEFRSLTKLKSTYTDRLPEQIDPKTNRVHTSYHQAVTSTGRLSSSDPNLQNIPIRTAEGRRIRAAFIAKPGFKMVSADYSQIELRIMAHMSQDEELVKAFTRDDDIHRSTAAAVFGVSLEEVNSEHRRSAKVINFGLLYGMSGFGLARELGIERKEAEAYIQRYFACFPGVKNYIDRTLAEAKTNGYVETLFGRRLYLPDLKASNVMRRKAAERAAVNAPMQGTNADIIKLVMIELDKYSATMNHKFCMIMQVHDELVFEIAEEVLDESCEKIRLVMEEIVPLSVKLKVGMGIGNNWDETHK